MLVGNQIIKQPDGKYAVFSSITDTIIFWDATHDEVVQFFVDRAAEDTRRSVEKVLAHVAADNPREAYYQFTMTWQEALKDDRAGGGTVWKEYGRG
ncbi:hypothetical protein [Lentzea sp. NPDC092896]|uniref:hypothetical protein n=1 Tax=Lentzea sp. NPDC092896 TaxID=3364127 RepID=UPI0038127397